MTEVILLYADGDVRAIDLDPSRGDVLRNLTGATTLGTINLRELGLTLWIDDEGLLRDLPLNLAGTLLVWGTGRRPVHPVVGTVVVVGLTHDGGYVDVPDDLLSLFAHAPQAAP